MLKLPERISVELRPRTRAAWAHVQALAQNPRVIVSLLADRRLSHIIDFLNNKWKSDKLHCYNVSFVVIIFGMTDFIQSRLIVQAIAEQILLTVDDCYLL